MTTPLHAKHYADRASHHSVSILENVRIATDTYRLRVTCPPIARIVLPGQFLMVRIADCNDPLIGRALALYDTFDGADGQPAGLDVVYVVKGKFTTHLSRLQPGQMVDLWGPLGNGFEMEPADHLVLVAGGIGQTPFLAVGKEALGKRQYGSPARQAGPPTRVTLCYGARRADLLAGLDDFAAAGIEVKVCTDDGSAGKHGLVTDLLSELLDQNGPNPLVLCCGPEPMMQAVSELTASRQVHCRVSLETPMACGIGICFTCVAQVRDEQGNWDYKRTCVDGPVFDAQEIVW